MLGLCLSCDGVRWVLAMEKMEEIIVEEVEPTSTPTPESINISGESMDVLLSPTITPIVADGATPTVTVTPTATPSEAMAEYGDEVKTEGEITTEVGGMIIESGPAVAWVNLINLINTNLAGSNFQVYLLNNFSGDPQDIDLNKVWKEMEKQTEETQAMIQETKNGFLVIYENKKAEVKNKVEATAESGGNSGEGADKALIVSGDAIALANVVNLINSDILDSQFLIAVVNIDGGSLGDLILPAPKPTTSTNAPLTPGASSTSTNNDSLESRAESGQNQMTTSGNGEIVTGQAVASSVSHNWINIESDDQMVIVINNLGEWSGQIYNWSSPGSVEKGEPQLTLVSWGKNEREIAGVSLTSNEALVSNDIRTEAVSGDNRLDCYGGDCEIRTGRAIALANLNNLINFRINRGQWFFGVINIVGNWRGNLIFAYPDVTVKIRGDKSGAKEGEEISYRVTYQNQGYEAVDGVELEINLDPGLEYIGEDSGLSPIRSGQKIGWKIGLMEVREQKSFELKARVRPQETGFRLIKRAWAAEVERRVTVTAIVRTSAVESDVNNNQSQESTDVLKEAGVPANDDQNQTDDGVDQEERLPEIKIGVKNNVNDYVYPGDVVTFEVEVENRSENKGKDSYLVHETVNGKGKIITRDELFVGNIGGKKTGKITYGIKVVGQVGWATKLNSRTWMVSFSETGKETESNIADTTYRVRPKIVVAAGNDKQGGEVLAAIDDNSWQLQPTKKIKGDNLELYLIGLALSGWWLARNLRQIKSGGKN